MKNRYPFLPQSTCRKKVNFLGYTKSIRGDLQKNPSIFKDIVQKGGREVNPISKNWKEMNFWQKLEREGSQNILSKIVALYFV